jgi:hypothetical protein
LLPCSSLSLPRLLRLEADASPRPKLVGAAVDRRQLGRSPSTETLLSLPVSSSTHSTPSRPLNLALSLFAPRLAGVDEAVAVDAWTPAEPAGRTPAFACKFCNRHRLLRPRLGRFPPSPELDDLGKHPLRETLAGVELSRAHARQPATTTVGRRSPPDRTARTPPYRFGHPGLAGEPAGLDPAQIWPGLARSGPPLPFLFLISSV